MTNTNDYTPIASFPLDEEKRSRRSLFYIGTWIVSAPIGSFLGAHLGMNLFSFFPGAGWIGAILGGGGGLILRTLAEPKFRIDNPTTGIFLTMDPLKRLLGKEDVITIYPPGPSYCYPWEGRDASNSISLEEATVRFNFDVVCTDGLIQAQGSYRLRANQNNPIAFQTGVAAVAEDMQDLVIAFAIEKMATKKITTVLKKLSELNELLKEEFVLADSPFEKRFGVHVGDVTIGQLKPSDDVMKTLSGITESTAINKGTAIMLGYTSMKTVNEAMAAGKLTNAEVKDARDRFLAVSGNLEGMDIKRNEYVLSAHGVDPKLAEAITSLAANVPEILKEWRDSKDKTGGK